MSTNIWHLRVLGCRVEMFPLHCFMFLAPGLSSELADPGRSQARNNIRELSMEKPALRVWRRRMGTVYIPFERSSKQSCCEGQGRRGLEGSA